ncbi:MAG: DUF2147 domain-containing protein [Betaproteobacteria bacterium]|nr:DUF2147 domain-containing protein [Betaproteobacteria bacterium]
MRGLLLGFALLVATASWAQSPAGLWRTIDDETNKERSLVRIVEVGGEFHAIVEKIFPQPGDDPDRLCKKCEGELKNKPVLGMRIMWGMKRKNDTKFDGGTILDPNNGKTYRCKLTLHEQGRKLEVRGYIGVSLIGRSQIWWREE